MKKRNEFGVRITVLLSNNEIEILNKITMEVLKNGHFIKRSELIRNMINFANKNRKKFLKYLLKQSG